MPRQRTARFPVLDTTVRRAEGSTSRPGALRARLVLLVLALVSLALLTVYLRESPQTGVLHRAQRSGVTLLTPFEVAGERVARPFHDVASYVSDLFGAKQENVKLRAELESLREQLIHNETAARENVKLRALLRYRSSSVFPKDYIGLPAQVIQQPASVFDQTILVAAGSDDGVVVHAPVVTELGLVGLVVDVTASTAKVRLLTDRSSWVSATVLETEASGVLRRGPSAGSELVLDLVGKDEVVRSGDLVITSGWKDVRDGIESLYPRGIGIGRVTVVGQSDVDLYKRIQVAPFVAFDSLAHVLILLDRPVKRGVVGR